MIDPHVHCRGGNWSYKETIEHVLSVAYRIGISGIFDMPNSDPLLIARDEVEKRLRYARDLKSDVFYGLYVGLTKEPKQIREAVQLWREHFPKSGDRVGVVGLKMFAGKSVGDLSVTSEADQSLVYRVLADEDFTGVVAVHSEKESEMHPELWNPKSPRTHCLARLVQAEYASVLDQIRFSGEAGFKGYLHIPHVSTNLSVHAVVNARKQGRKISMGVTPHHLLFSDERMMQPDGILYKVNPPLRDCIESVMLLDYLRDGTINWIETDHAPHTIDEKTGKAMDAKGNPKYDSGIPSLVFYPKLLDVLVKSGFSPGMFDSVTHKNIEDVFGIKLPVWQRQYNPRKLMLELAKEYEFFKERDWS